jgi:hypothetical protein
MLLPLLLLAPILSYAQVCGDSHSPPSKKTISVTLPQKPSGPTYYYREGVDFVIFIPEDVIIRELADRELLGDPMIKRLSPLIRAQRPLREDRDLYYFNLSDWLYYDSIRRLVAQSIEQGNAAIVNAAGAWLSSVTVVHQRKAKTANTIIYAGVNRHSRILTLLDCVTD